MKALNKLIILMVTTIFLALTGCITPKNDSSLNPWVTYEPALYIQNVDGTNRVKLLDGKWDHLMMTPDETKLILSNGNASIVFINLVIDP